MLKIKNILFLFLLFNSFFYISAEKLLLKNNWQYSIEKNGKPDLWKKVDISTPIKKQGIILKKGDAIYYKTSFTLNEVNNLLPDINNLGLYFGRIQGDVEYF